MSGPKPTDARPSVAHISFRRVAADSTRKIWIFNNSTWLRYGSKAFQSGKQMTLTSSSRSVVLNRSLIWVHPVRPRRYSRTSGPLR